MRVECTWDIRSVEGPKEEFKTEHEVSDYPGSMPPSAVLVGAVICQHWGVENGLHWTLEVAFREDLSRVRMENGSENMATLHKVALNLLKQETLLKRGVAGKRMAAGWDDDYLLKILNAQLD